MECLPQRRTYARKASGRRGARGLSPKTSRLSSAQRPPHTAAGRHGDFGHNGFSQNGLSLIHI
eukprot:5291453-Pyramimonas_sp.AAC.1